jgi:hypothetical protein
LSPMPNTSCNVAWKKSVKIKKQQSNIHTNNAEE